MALSLRAVPSLVVLLFVSVLVAADDATNSSGRKAPDSGAQPAVKKAGKAAEAEARAIRLTKPWKDLASLTEDQKRQINQIHRKAVAEIKAVELKEKDDIMALLNDQQKAEVTSMLEKAAAERKAKGAQKPAKPAAGAAEKDADTVAAAASDEADAEREVSAGSN